ncbi:MAG: transposase [Bacteroidales bacterium]|jgi:transposase|nr:transposase [Bacteroidales bacterium]
MVQANRDLVRHIGDLMLETERKSEENAKLRAENRELRSENKKLKNRIEVLERTMEERIRESVENAVLEATKPLLSKIAEQEKEIQRLKAQANKDSTNSSKPPGSNGFKKIPNNREKSEKKQGGQNGHNGTRLNIPENLDELVADGKAEHIIVSEVAEGEAYTSDWTIDLKVIPVFTERRRKTGQPPRIGYGPQLKTVVVYLLVIGLMSFKRVSQFFKEISNNLITVSKAALAEYNHIAAEKIDLSENINDLLNGKVINVDETPTKTSERPNKFGALETAENTTFQAYIRTYSNAKTTVLTVNPTKSEESVITDNILTQFYGIVAQDNEAKFYNFGIANATCGEHLTRDLKGMSDLQMLSWAAEVRDYFLEMNKHKKDDVRDGITICEPDLLRSFEDRYDGFITKGRLQLAAMNPKVFAYDELRRMVNRLEKHKDNYMLFMRDYDVPFTNNQAERDLRHCKTKQKVSGCFRSRQGIKDYCKIRSFLDTANKRGQNLFLALQSLFFSPEHALV